MGAFSWEKFILQADKNLLRQAKTLARKQDQQYKLDHPDEAKDAERTPPDYTRLTLRIKKELQTKRSKILERRERIGIGQR